MMYTKIHARCMRCAHDLDYYRIGPSRQSETAGGYSHDPRSRSLAPAGARYHRQGDTDGRFVEKLLIIGRPQTKRIHFVRSRYPYSLRAMLEMTAGLMTADEHNSACEWPLKVWVSFDFLRILLTAHVAVPAGSNLCRLDLIDTRLPIPRATCHFPQLLPPWAARNEARLIDRGEIWRVP